VPALLRAAADSDPERALNAIDTLDNHLYHQGGWVCSAAGAALPYLLELARDPTLRYRDELVKLIGRLGRVAVEVKPRFVDPGWAPALADAVPELLALLADTDPVIRREGTSTVAGTGLPHAEVADALWARWLQEPDQVTRRDLVLAMGRLLADRPDDEDLLVHLHDLVGGQDPQLRLAALHALAETEPETPAAHVGQLVAAVRHPDAAGWRDSAWLGGTRQTIVNCTGQLLRGDPAK
jgi:hypothetical protein